MSGPGSGSAAHLGALCCIELAARRLQLIEESKQAGGATAYEGAKFFLGFRRGTSVIAPALSKHVAAKLQEEVSVMKERRKHAEERKLGRDTKPPGKGAGRGSGGGTPE